MKDELLRRPRSGKRLLQLAVLLVRVAGWIGGFVGMIVLAVCVMYQTYLSNWEYMERCAVLLILVIQINQIRGMFQPGKKKE